MKQSIAWRAVTIIGMLGASTAVYAQSLPRQPVPLVQGVSDVEAPFAGLPPGGGGFHASPSILPSTEIYGVLRRNGFSPLGIPRRRGPVYSIAALSPEGDDGRLLIDARSGRILEFIPARAGRNDEFGDAAPWASPDALPPPPEAGLVAPPRPYDPQVLPSPRPPDAAPYRRSGLRPPMPIPQVANRDAPTPAERPTRALPREQRSEAAIDWPAPPPLVAPRRPVTPPVQPLE